MTYLTKEPFRFIMLRCLLAVSQENAVVQQAIRPWLLDGDVETFRSFEEELIARAIRASEEKAIHYNERDPFKVGAALLLRDMQHKLHIFTGANLKGGSSETVKLCAERVAIARAWMDERVSYFYPLGIVVYGVARPDDVSKRPTETLHPCHDCRSWLHTMPRIGSDFLITCVANGTGKIERLTLREVLEYHSAHFIEANAPRFE